MKQGAAILLLTAVACLGCSSLSQSVATGAADDDSRWSPVDRPRYGFLDRPKPLPELTLRIEGRAQVVDGDTLIVDDHTLHLAGVDAPELGQLCRDADGLPYRCGESYTGQLRQRLQRDRVQCDAAPVVEDGKEIEGEYLARCRHFGVDLGGWMVQQGYAVARNQHSPYLDAEIAAAENRRGLWAGFFERPEDWRQRNR